MQMQQTARGAIGQIKSKESQLPFVQDSSSSQNQPSALIASGTRPGSFGAGGPNSPQSKGPRR